MNKEEILKKVDHTLLKQQSTWEDIKQICDDGIKFNTASVCIPACFVHQAKEYVKDKIRICTVIGFPNGYSTTAAKVFETKDAIKNGADEIDMVINIGMLKEKQYSDILSEINQIKEACDGKLLKVIIEKMMVILVQIIQKKIKIIIIYFLKIMKNGVKSKNVYLLFMYLL